MVRGRRDDGGEAALDQVGEGRSGGASAPGGGSPGLAA